MSCPVPRLATAVLCCLLSASCQLAWASAPAPFRLPPPDVEGLDTAAAAQVEALHAAVAAILEDAAASSPERAEAAGELGRYYHALGRPMAAEAVYRLARTLDPEDYRWSYFLGVLLEAAGRLEEAAAVYESTLVGRTGVPALMRLARVYTALGRPEAARRNASQAARLDPDVEAGEFDDPLVAGLVERAEERAHLLLGRIAFRHARFPEAADAFERALEEKPDSIAGLVNLGLTLGALGRAEEAIARFERAVELAPADPAPRLQLGVQLAAQGELGGAKAQLEAAVALAPEEAAASTELAAVLWQAGDPEAALGRYRQAIGLDPTAERPRLGEVQVLRALGRHAEVRERLEEAHALLPNSGLVAYGLAWALATSPQAELRDGATALELAQGVFAARHRLEDAILVAAALGALDRCAEAAELLRTLAAAAEETHGGSTAAAHVQRRIEVFAQGPPCLLPPSGQVD